MIDYQQISGRVHNRGAESEYRRNNILDILLVCAWGGMIFFFVFGLFTLIAQSDSAIMAMLLSLGLWLTCGIVAIRIRQGRRKFLKVQP